MKPNSGAAQFAIQSATVSILTGDNWANFIKSALDSMSDEILISMYMVSPHWGDNQKNRIDLLSALEQCGFTGYKCRAILNHQPATSKTKNYNVDAARRLRDSGWQVRMMGTPRTLHEKIIIIDKALTILGSHNLSWASAASNLDTSLAIHNHELAVRLERQFWERWRIAEALAA